LISYVQIFKNVLIKVEADDDFGDFEEAGDDFGQFEESAQDTASLSLEESDSKQDDLLNQPEKAI